MHMDHYIQDKAKLKAIATFTFNSITPKTKREISTTQASDIFKLTLLKYDPNFSDLEIQDMVEAVDKSHKGVLNFDDFLEVFEKAFEMLHEHLSHRTVSWLLYTPYINIIWWLECTDRRNIRDRIQRLCSNRLQSNCIPNLLWQKSNVRIPKLIKSPTEVGVVK